MKRLHILITLFIVCICILAYLLSNKTFSSKNNRNMLCGSGGTVPFPGFDRLGADVIIKCSCDGELIQHNGQDDGRQCWDCGWLECSGKIDYECYKMETQDPIQIKPSPWNYFSYVKSHSKKISCPPNHWMNQPCTDDKQCSLVGCIEGFTAKCEESGCSCK